MSKILIPSNFWIHIKDDDFTLKRLRQNRQESIALNGISITPLSLLPNPNNQVKPSSKPSMADIQAKVS